MTDQTKSNAPITAAEFDRSLKDYLKEMGANITDDAPVLVVGGHCAYRAGGKWWIAFLNAEPNAEGFLDKDKPFSVVAILPAHVVYHVGKHLIEDIEDAGEDPVAYLQSVGVEAMDASDFDPSSLDPKGHTLQ